MQKVKWILLFFLLTFSVQANDEEIIANLEMLENMEFLQEEEFENIIKEDDYEE